MMPLFRCRHWAGHADTAVTGRRFRDRCAMAKMIRKANLPQKTCVNCGRPFAWRKKWERVWDEVRYCSDRCRAARPKQAG
jgi:hypothetical protein